MDHENAQDMTHPARQMDLREGYRQMAADREQELEAEEWTEAMIGDISEPDPVSARALERD